MWLGAAAALVVTAACSGTARRADPPAPQGAAAALAAVDVDAQPAAKSCGCTEPECRAADLDAWLLAEVCSFAERMCSCTADEKCRDVYRDFMAWASELGRTVEYPRKVRKNGDELDQEVERYRACLSKAAGMPAPPIGPMWP